VYFILNKILFKPRYELEETKLFIMNLRSVTTRPHGVLCCFYSAFNKELAVLHLPKMYGLYPGSLKKKQTISSNAYQKVSA
jgi:hypothetical protein